MKHPAPISYPAPASRMGTLLAASVLAAFAVPLFGGTTAHAQAAATKKPVKRTATKKAVQKTPLRRTTIRSTKALIKAVKSPVAPVFKPIPPYRKDVPPGSYVIKPARTDSGVYDQAISRSMILQRYQYAWKTTPEETLRRLEGLKLTQLKTAGVYRVYYARPNGAWGYKVRSVPVGTFVFALPNTSKPVMLQVCGNPVEEVLPPRNAKNKGAVPPFSPAEGDSGLVLEGLGDTGNLYGFAPQVPEFLEGGELLSGASGALSPIAPVAADSFASYGGASFAFPGGGGGFNLGNLLFPIVGTAVGSQISNFGGNGGNNIGNNIGNNTPGNGNNGNNIGVEVVPEPSVGAFGVALLATLGLALVWPSLVKSRSKS